MSSFPGQGANPTTVARIGRWVIPAIPFGWKWVDGFGIQRSGENVVPSNVYLREDELLAGDKLIPYIRTQISVMQSTFDNPMMAGPIPGQFPGAEESLMLMLRHQPKDQVSVMQVQHYMRAAKWIGIVTLTTVEPELLKVRPDFDQFLKLLQITPAE